jgi:NADPH2:quinone reductase
VDLLVDFLAGPFINDSMRHEDRRAHHQYRPDGRERGIRLRPHSLRRIQYLGMTFRTRTVEDFGVIANACSRTSGRRFGKDNCACRSMPGYRWIVSRRLAK